MPFSKISHECAIFMCVTLILQYVLILKIQHVKTRYTSFWLIFTALVGQKNTESFTATHLGKPDYIKEYPIYHNWYCDL